MDTFAPVFIVKLAWKKTLFLSQFQVWTWTSSNDNFESILFRVRNEIAFGWLIYTTHPSAHTDRHTWVPQAILKVYSLKHGVYWMYMFISLEFSFQHCQTERMREKKMEDVDFFVVLRTIYFQQKKNSCYTMRLPFILEIYGMVRLDCLKIIFLLNGNGEWEREREKNNHKSNFQQEKQQHHCWKHQHGSTTSPTILMLGKMDCIRWMDTMWQMENGNEYQHQSVTSGIHVCNNNNHNKNDEKSRKVRKSRKCRRKKVWAPIFLWITCEAKTSTALAEMKKNIHIYSLTFSYNRWTRASSHIDAHIRKLTFNNNILGNCISYFLSLELVTFHEYIDSIGKVLESSQNLVDFAKRSWRILRTHRHLCYLTH